MYYDADPGIIGGTSCIAWPDVCVRVFVFCGVLGEGGRRERETESLALLKRALHSQIVFHVKAARYLKTKLVSCRADIRALSSSLTCLMARPCLCSTHRRWCFTVWRLPVSDRVLRLAATVHRLRILVPACARWRLCRLPVLCTLCLDSARLRISRLICLLVLAYQ